MDQKSALHQLRTLTRSRRKINKPTLLQERMIALQESFLSPGMHCINVESIDQGRHLMHLGLESLGMHEEVAVLGVPPTKASEPYRDLHDEMDAWDALSFDTGSMEDFLLSAFQCDFLAIEYTQELQEQHWYGKFELLLHKYAISRSIPIVLFTYSDQMVDLN